MNALRVVREIVILGAVALLLVGCEARLQVESQPIPALTLPPGHVVICHRERTPDNWFSGSHVQETRLLLPQAGADAHFAAAHNDSLGECR